MAAALMGRTVATNNCGYWQFTHSGVTYDFVSFFLSLSEDIYNARVNFDSNNSFIRDYVSTFCVGQVENKC